MLAVAASLPLRLWDVFLRGPVAPGYRATYASPLIIVFSRFGQHFSVEQIHGPWEKRVVRNRTAERRFLNLTAVIRLTQKSSDAGKTPVNGVRPYHGRFRLWMVALLGPFEDTAGADR